MCAVTDSNLSTCGKLVLKFTSLTPDVPHSVPVLQHVIGETQSKRLLQNTFQHSLMGFPAAHANCSMQENGPTKLITFTSGTYLKEKRPIYFGVIGKEESVIDYYCFVFILA